MLNRWVRYLPVMDLLADASGKTILEVGSGSRGLGEFLNRPFVGCDITFDSEPPAKLMQPVLGTGTQLPFRNASFDTILCLDTFEHVPRALRPRVLAELLRVSGSTVIFGAPMGPAARDADLRLHRGYVRRGKAEPVWLEEHVQLIDEFPTREEFRELLTTHGYSYSEIPGEGARFHSILSFLEDVQVTGRLLGTWSRAPWRNLVGPLIRRFVLSGSYRRYFVVRK